MKSMNCTGVQKASIFPGIKISNPAGLKEIGLESPVPPNQRMGKRKAAGAGAAKNNLGPKLSPFYIKESVWNQMLQHCRSELPFEGCGLLSGTEGYASNSWRMKNIEASPISFAMDDEEVKAAFLEMEQRNEKLTAIFHSHPTSRAYPSSQDIKHANYPEAIYIIVSFSGKVPMVKGYQIINGRTLPVRLIRH